MSQILYRQRLRDRQDAAAKAVAGNSSLPAKSLRAAPAETAPEVVIPPADGIAVEVAVDEPAQVSQRQSPVCASEDQPVDTPAEDQQQTQARATAQSLAGLEAEQYTAALQDLQVNQPKFYPLVVDELNRMVSDNVDDEGDGFDLSGVANPTITE